MQRIPDEIRSLFRSIEGIKAEFDVPLSTLGRWKIGGDAAVVLTPSTEEGLAKGLRAIQASGLPRLVIGDGSNLLFDDAGFHGVVVRIGRAMSDMHISGSRVVAQGGLWVPRFALELARAGLTGAEHIVGIPGTLGGLAVMNGGSQRKGIGSSIEEVRCLTQDGDLQVFSQEDCRFAYRRSSLQENNAIVTSITFAFEVGDQSEIRRAMLAIMGERRRKFPLKKPNCGSVFVSDPAMYASVGPPGRAIEQVGLRGTQVGGARIADLHCNFIVNCGDASSRDVLALIGLARTRVHDNTGYWMDCEVRYVSPEGAVMPAHEAAEFSVS
ncbi:UDP-N-acetylmuramate dehydrogenase [Novosphingobium sp. FGD1]|jgi:UDP-N-acetylmuramate dehydrogenase|uniref:UDP-N-acetylenolpyruvoylglucosamine reductase n=1 Tax=Novosphingobium silvae TaxID=2692619 RepID=A0A7X4K9G1_9SPHN|nr:UDP-N-acetylmuramate dehydrogenase [Novosphingobium silvae]MYM00345.1 UDP-N-acetylmuramate dehydrogenase [Novosphingobium silvae]